VHGSVNTDLLRLDVDDGGVATVWIDDPRASVNKISRAALDGFSEVLDSLEQRDDLLGVVFISAKEASFIVGADLEMIDNIDTPAEARALCRRGHRLLRRMDALSVPTVAAIDGPCMGGGLELVLGCDYRLASTHEDTKLALPEIKLGLIPGGGGTQYLPRLIGVQRALTLMLTGKNTYPEKARSIGLVDALTHPAGLYGASKRAVRQLAAGTLTVDRDKQALGERLLESTSVSRRLLYQQAERRARQRTNDHYPAPPRLIDAVRTGREEGLDAGLDAERWHFGELVCTPESHALVQLFFARQEAKDPPVAGAPFDVTRVGILGAGLMGGGIAEVTAGNGLDVVLKDRTRSLAVQGKRRVWTAMEEKREKGIVNRFERDRATERVVPTAANERMTRCDVVIEAVPEDLDLKHQVLSEMEDVVSEEAVLATNTSSIPVAEIANGVETPGRVIGMHYFSPVGEVPLVELIPTEQTTDATLATAFALVQRQGKTAIVVGDGPGFYTTRILSLYLNEALQLLEEGADVARVDALMRDLGFPMGPFELFDFVGIDVASKITQVMGEYLPLDHVDLRNTAMRLADRNLLGRKTDVGFYHYDSADDNSGRAPTEVNEDIYRSLGPTTRTTPAPAVVRDRLLLTMVNEAVRCLSEGILRSPADGDFGAVFGLGFPAYLGGPFRYIDQQGPGHITRCLGNLAYRFGRRFAPADLLVELEESDASVYASPSREQAG
jgi:3-hydroxyacyl-CoA dehydrogenase/enoyl-CoA hydratase/3-hydroxybutyryl-CoA epimerase